MTDVKVVMRQAKADGTLANPATEEGQKRHELHPSIQPVVTVPTNTAADIATLLADAGVEDGVPDWVTAARLYVGKTGRVAYSTDGTPPAFAEGDVTHGAPVESFFAGHPIFGNPGVSALKLVAETGATKVTIELIG